MNTIYWGIIAALKPWLKQWDKKDIAGILIPTLQEEKATDVTLTNIAESGINEEATQEKVNV